MIILLIAAIAVCVVDWRVSRTLADSAFATGWVLLAMVLLLTLYNLRKRLPFLPLGNSATWLQIHIYVGLLSGLIFIVHIGWHFPNGWFESLLALAFAGVFVSGVIGLIASRSFAKRLGARGSDYLYSRLPRIRHQLKGQAEQLILDCASETESAALLEFYADRLQPYFERYRNYWHHLVLSDRPLRGLRRELEGQAQYLTDRGRQALVDVEQKVVQKNEVDFHYAHQSVLKYWLFIHVPLTYMMLVMVAAHVVLVHAFWN